MSSGKHDRCNRSLSRVNAPTLASQKQPIDRRVMDAREMGSGFSNGAWLCCSLVPMQAMLEVSFPATLRQGRGIRSVESGPETRMHLPSGRHRHEVELLWIEELDVIKEIDDGKDKPRRIIPKGGVSDKSENQVTIKSLPGRSPDYGDGIMMRMYFEVVREPEPMMRWL